MEKAVVSEETKQRKASKMLLIVGIVSIIMMFMGLTSAYIVSRGGAAFWVNITIPPAFWTSTIVMVLSSISMFVAARMVKAGNKQMTTLMLVLSFALGLFFIKSQLKGWKELSDIGLNFAGDNFLEHLNGEYGKDYYITDAQDKIIDLKNDGHYYDPSDPSGKKILDKAIQSYKNPAASYMNFLSFLHAAHVGGGLLYLLYVLILALAGRLGTHNALKVSQAATYWHFVGLLWVYLLLFFYFIH